MCWYDVLPSPWNHQILTFDDFEIFCLRDRIKVVELPMKAHGLYIDYVDTPIILLNRGLNRHSKWFVAFHELAHHWLHRPGDQHKWAFESKVDFEANTVAACALIPRPLLQHTDLEIRRQHSYSQKLIRFRREILRSWDI